MLGPYSVSDSLLYLCDGTIRVSQCSDTGREVALYRLEAGEGCALITVCILAEEAYNAEGVVETDVPAIV